jgi:hypothetical protein
MKVLNPRDICLNNLRFASIWMGTTLGVGQRNELGLKDWIFPPAGPNYFCLCD